MCILFSIPITHIYFPHHLGFQPKVPLPRFGEPSPTPDDYQEQEFPPPAPALAITDFNDIEDEESLEEAMLADRLLRLRQRYRKGLYEIYRFQAPTNVELPNF